MLDRAPSATPIVIQPVQRGDIATLLEIIHAAYIEYEGWLVPPSGAHAETVESLAAKLTKGEGALAWQDQIAVGSVLFEPRGHEMYLGRLAVPPAHRRRGTGALLVSHVEAEALRRGLSRVTLGVRLQLPENAAFYTKLGYDIAGYGMHPGFTEPTYIAMVKNLNPPQLRYPTPA
jgi:predicted N-acetyltransferase YhbS